MATYDYLYFLDSENPKKFIFYHDLSRKTISGHTRPKTLDKKIGKITIFKANLRLVKKWLYKNHTDLQYLDLYL